MHSRTRGRRFLLQCRYASQLNGEDVLSSMEMLGSSQRLDPELDAWVRKLACQVDLHRTEIDAALEKVLHNWSLERLNILTRLIIEQAVAECWYMEVPGPVAIDEALALAREFEGPDSASFVNGVLDGLLFPGSRRPDGEDAPAR